MSDTTTLLQNFGEVTDNPILLDNSVTTPVCEGFNVVLASFQTLALQYQKHHFVVDGAEFYSLHEFFNDSYKEVLDHVHEIGERLDGLGGVPVATLRKIVELCCFEQEIDGVFSCRQMVENDLKAEQALISVIRRQASQAESLGDRGTRYLYEKILLKTEERAYHLSHFLAKDSLTLGFVQTVNN